MNLIKTRVDLMRLGKYIFLLIFRASFKFLYRNNCKRRCIYNKAGKEN